MANSYNSYVLARESNPEEVLEQFPNYQDYFEDLALELIGDTVTAREAQAGNPPVHLLVVHDVEQNLLDKNKVCKECSLQGVGRPGVTRYGCRGCHIAVHPKCQSAHQCRHSNMWLDNQRTICAQTHD